MCIIRNDCIEVEDTRRWDSFQDPILEQTTGSSVDLKWLNRSIVALKIFIYGFVWLVIVVSSVISKTTFLFMASHVKQDTKVEYCYFRRKLFFDFKSETKI